MTDIQSSELTMALNCARDILARAEDSIGENRQTNLQRAVKEQIQLALEHVRKAALQIRINK